MPKYRKKVLYGKLRNVVREIIKILCKYKDVQIIDGAVCADHIHLSVAIPLYRGKVNHLEKLKLF
ncbi:MAG: transposase [Clostridium sp.]|nr:transposase [Clostridium sp.]